MVQAAGQTMMDPWGRCSWASRLFFSSPEDSAGTQRPCMDSNDLTFPIACWQNLQCAHQSWPEIDSIQRWFATSFFWVTLYKPSKLMSQQKSHSVPWWEEDGGVEGCACIVSCENSKKKSLLNNHPQENVGSHQIKIPHIQGQRRSPSKMVGGAKMHLESN